MCGTIMVLRSASTSEKCVLLDTSHVQAKRIYLLLVKYEFKFFIIILRIFPVDSSDHSFVYRVHESRILTKYVTLRLFTTVLFPIENF